MSEIYVWSELVTEFKANNKVESFNLIDSYGAHTITRNSVDQHLRNHTMQSKVFNLLFSINCMYK